VVGKMATHRKIGGPYRLHRKKRPGRSMRKVLH